MRKKMEWPCRVTARTHLPNGRIVSLNARVEGAGDVEGAMLMALNRHRRAWAFLGSAINAVTPLGQRVVRIVDEKDGALTLIRE